MKPTLPTRLGLVLPNLLVAVFATWLSSGPVTAQSKGRTETVVSEHDGVISLTPGDARLHGDMKVKSLGDKQVITGWQHARDSISWEIEVTQDGSYQVSLRTACAHEGAVIMIHGKGVGKLAFPVPQTESLADFKNSQVGDLKLTKGTRVTITLRAVADAWQPVNLERVKLVARP